MLSKLFFCVSFRFIQRLLSDPSLSVEKQSEMVHDFYGVSLNLTGKLSTRFFFRSVYSKVQTACGVLASLIQFPRDIINILCTNLVFLVLTVS